ncbi:hypothetical protein MRB53_026762 [Persea americana]|uniref:Uncharacterized protein n=1 Tax=Persea americana TaxID=3435 RepID=A0ACC2LJP0_PERAE|nr:hypothetical protein MRB53_026762 [Persea americana]
MSTAKGELIAIDLSAGIIRKWKETYQWIPIFGSLLAFATAFVTGANSIPVPFSTSVGSGALTLLKASILACIINVPVSAFAINSTGDALLSDFLKENQPSEGFLMWSLVVVLITTSTYLKTTPQKSSNKQKLEVPISDLTCQYHESDLNY